MQSRRDDALEAAADRLLREHDTRSRPTEYPFYARSSLRQLSRREDLLSYRELQGPTRSDSHASLLLERLLPALELTAENHALLDLLRSGHTVTEAAATLGLTVKAARRRLDRIVRRLRHQATAAGGYQCLVRQVHEEQRRPVRYRPEQHCKPGAEACRKDGRCKYRWYLYGLSAQEE